MTADALRKAKTEYYKSEFEEAKSVPNEKWKLINRIIPEDCGFPPIERM